MTYQIFIDGEAGTTGLEIRKRLEDRTDLSLLSIADDKRKDVAERTRLLNGCDVAILCLPDAAAREAVGLVTNPAVRVIDASTAFRVAAGWTYGFPELTPEQEDLIRVSKRVANPGCYPTGALALVRPLVDAGLLSPDTPLTVDAISGYSGGGKELIALCEKPDGKGQGRASAFCLYGLDQAHKHLPEMRVHGGLRTTPVFLPSYSSGFYRGMLVHIVLRGLSGDAVQAVYEKRYVGKPFIRVEPLATRLESGFILTPEAQNQTNNVQIRVFASSTSDAVILTACLDNLGKGASGAVVQNLDLMLSGL